MEEGGVWCSNDEGDIWICIDILGCGINNFDIYVIIVLFVIVDVLVKYVVVIVNFVCESIDDVVSFIVKVFKECFDGMYYICII